MPPGEVTAAQRQAVLGMDAAAGIGGRPVELRCRDQVVAAQVEVLRVDRDAGEREVRRVGAEVERQRVGAWRERAVEPRRVAERTSEPPPEKRIIATITPTVN